VPFTASVRPITVDDDTLREHLRSAEVPALLMTVAQLTGDLSILRDDCRPSGWLFLPQGGLSADQQDEARELAVRALRRIRDGEPVPPPGPEVLRAITSWAMGIDTEELLPLLAEEIVLAGEDPKAPGWTKDVLAPDVDVRVAIIGAGLSGLLAAYRLSQAKVPFVIYEKNSEVGGTWFENTYPGCRVDVASPLEPDCARTGRAADGGAHDAGQRRRSAQPAEATGHPGTDELPGPSVPLRSMGPLG
jgi:4-hydroxyacetophenone monooxygenase